MRARDTAQDAAGVVVAGSLSHMVPIRQGAAASDAGQLPSQAELEDAFHELGGILADAGCDLIILEGMYDLGRIPPALDAALATKLPVWFGASARRGRDGRPISFHQSEDISLEAVAEMIPHSGIDAAGIMHTTAEIVADALKVVRGHFGGPLMAYPDWAISRCQIGASWMSSRRSVSKRSAAIGLLPACRSSAAAAA